MIYHRRCCGCGTDVEAGNAGGVIYCEECKEIQRQERRAIKLRNLKPQIEYQIVRDAIPPELGGFSKGAIISAKEMDTMLQPEYRSLSVGTIVEHKSGKQFIVLNRRGSNGLRLQRILRSK
jgi:predicted nucleic acid-binding Zn ribbon protein